MARRRVLKKASYKNAKDAERAARRFHLLVRFTCCNEVKPCVEINFNDYSQRIWTATCNECERLVYESDDE